MQPERIGPYRIEGVLGAGGMGTVYAAYDERLERGVAIKTIRHGSDITPERRERLWREARATAALEHPAIARVYDVLGEGDDLHIVMEKVAGTSLADRLAEGPLAVATTIEIVRQIAAGLAAAHRKGIVHRDLKAANVMCTPEGGVKILDFGLAKRLDAPPTDAPLTQEGTVLGTCHAMSPEQAMGRLIDPRSDLFALGSLLYQMLAGQHPFAVPSPMATLHRIVQHRPPRLDLIRPEVPRVVADLVERLLEKEPERRPASAADVADRLASFGLPTTTRQADELTTETRDRPPRRSRRWPAALLGAAAVAVVAIGIVIALRLAAPARRTVAVPACALPPAAAADVVLAGRAVREALLGTIADLAGLSAPDPQTVDGANGDAVAIARAAAADEVLYSDVASTDDGYQVTLRLIDGARGTLTWTGGTVDVATHDLQLLADAVAARLRTAYPGRAQTGTRFPSTAEPGDYAAYLRIESELLNPPPGVDEAMLVDELAAIRTRSPRLLEASLLETTTSVYLYRVTGNASWLVRADQVAEQARRLAPQDPRPLAAAANVALAAREPAEARRYLAELQRVHPGDLSHLDLAARIEEIEGNSERASELYRELIRVNPSWWNLRNAALLARRSGDIGKARSLLTDALERAPTNRYVLSTLAEIELLHGDPKRAADLYRALLERSSSSIFQGNLGVSLMLAGRFDQAREVLEQALRRERDDPTTLLNLADCLALTGHVDQAEVHYRHARELVAERPTDDVEALSVSGQVDAHLGDRLAAARSARQLLVVAPDDPQVQFEVALIYAIIGELASAEVNAMAALEAGVNPRWFELPWFDDLRRQPSIAAHLVRVSE